MAGLDPAGITRSLAQASDPARWQEACVSFLTRACSLFKWIIIHLNNSLEQLNTKWKKKNQMHTMKEQIQREENVWSLPGNWDKQRRWRWNFCAGSVVTSSGDDEDDDGANLLCYPCSLFRRPIFFCLCSFAPVLISLFGFPLRFLLCYLLSFLFSPLYFLPPYFFLLFLSASPFFFLLLFS
jgi:hypothetical protein